MKVAIFGCFPEAWKTPYLNNSRVDVLDRDCTGVQETDVSFSSFSRGIQCTASSSEPPGRKAWIDCGFGNSVCFHRPCKKFGFLQGTGVDILKQRRGSRLKILSSKRQFWKGEPLVKGRVTLRALHLIKELKMRSIDADDDSLHAILRRWVSSMNPERRDFLDVLKEFDTRESRDVLIKLSKWVFSEDWFDVCQRDYTKLLERLGRVNRTDEAEKLFKEMEQIGFNLDLVTLTVYINVLGKAKMLDRAKQVFEKVKVLGLQPDEKLYHALMVAHGYAGIPWEAESVLEEMEASGVSGTVENYCALINGYGRVGQVQEAQRVFDLMLYKGVRANTKVMTALLDVYGKNGSPEKAFAVFESLRQQGFAPDDRSMSILVAAFERKDLLSEAVGVLLELEAAGIKPGSETLTTLLGWFGRVGSVKEAEEIFEEIVSSGLQVSPRTCTSMYKAYVSAGWLEKASTFAKDMSHKGIFLDEMSYIVPPDEALKSQPVKAL